ncbi:methylmalonyl Co-A mutase-associated GTPase MeaB [Salinibacter grassmerensis]|uniref:methylmalonyl Co-A mutase-associated GTPase MeaB n=1 Tax=Salinibacter grassmerensis TaxID=3040353 RepID=UPI0021E6E170|nr:methylmalonyl Co-A mutase-associated GTPase MeaB [Salinibacter grassmerensis]
MAPLNPNLQDQSRPSRPDARSATDYVTGILDEDRVMLSQAITLLESTRPDHRDTARTVVEECLPHSGDSIRVAVTGVPGVGKSTFIEALGQRLVAEGHRLAVLTVDPSSERSKGSILGDKTRMGALASDEDAFIRPSPTAGALGGVAPRTREAILLCEAAGYDTVFVETVGVGQSEISVRSMVDFFLLLALAGAGDELQGIKRGIVEVADAIAVTKADGDNREPAKAARAEYEKALRLLSDPDSGWEPPVLTCSSQTGAGLEDVWDAVERYRTHAQETGFFEEQRRRQAQHWMEQAIEQRLHEEFFSDPDVQAAQENVEAAVRDGRLSSLAAAERLLSVHRDSTG